MQIAVYAALAVAALMLGARWIDSGGEAASASSTGSIPSTGGGEASGGESFEPTTGDLVVHVAGAVEKPGVYRLPPGSRVTDAINRAGGPAGEAAPDAINLAAPLADGQQVQVPSRSPTGTGVASAGGEDGPISLGAATVEDLDTIEGIGPVTAEQIIAFRDESGGISSVDDLDEISGIGPATMEALRARLQP